MIQEVLISPLGWAVTICPECGLKSHSKPGKELRHKVLGITCSCGAKYQVIFDTRAECRKKCSLPGILVAEENIAVEINNISEIGAYFEGDELNIDVDGFYHLKIKINEHWINVSVRVVRENQKIAGVEFVNLGYNEKKIIESYLLSN
jgi:hypothetical protein